LYQILAFITVYIYIMKYTYIYLHNKLCGIELVFILYKVYKIVLNHNNVYSNENIYIISSFEKNKWCNYTKNILYLQIALKKNKVFDSDSTKSHSMTAVVAHHLS